jgi:hypothetical protein
MRLCKISTSPTTFGSSCRSSPSSTESPFVIFQVPRKDECSWSKTHVFSPFFALLDDDVDVVGIFQSLLVSAPFSTEPCMLGAFALADLVAEIRICARADFLDLDDD